MPLALVASAVALASFHVTPRGLLLAALSGGVVAFLIATLGTPLWLALIAGILVGLALGLIMAEPCRIAKAARPARTGRPREMRWR